MLNVNLKEFKLLHQKKKNQIIFVSHNCKGDDEILNLIDNFLIDKNSFIFESVEKRNYQRKIYNFLEKIPIKYGNLIIKVLLYIQEKKIKKK